MKTAILISGFGGQGIMSLGKIIAHCALKESKFVTYFPSYGAEVRGGTAHCFIKISDGQISSPLIERPDIAIIMNEPSLDKFEKKIKKGGIVIFNSDIIQRRLLRKDIRKIKLPLNRLALDCQNIKVANIVALGALISLDHSLFKREVVREVLREAFVSKIVQEQNLQALSKGESIIRKNA
jgi:2-oxoglutarate ferredoxin oxidoreductase subunit gamma